MFRTHESPFLVILAFPFRTTQRLPVTFASGLVLRFERPSAHGYRDFEWRTKPLGLVFSDEQMPMTVTEVHEEAEHMGVRVGDVLKGYGREWDLVVFFCMLHVVAIFEK